MGSKKTDCIIIYSSLFASILGIAASVRIYVMDELQMDEFSGSVTFLMTCLLFGAAYICFQSILDEWLPPKVEHIFAKKRQQPEPKSESEAIPAVQDKTIPKYEEYRQTAQQRVQQEQMQRLENVLSYTVRELALYMEEKEMQKLYEHIRFFQYASEKECRLIEPSVTVDPKIKTIDLMHFGWNIGNQFHKSGIETATFIKRVFARALKESDISTIIRKLKAEGTCIIKIKKEL